MGVPRPEALLQCGRYDAHADDPIIGVLRRRNEPHDHQCPIRADEPGIPRREVRHGARDPGGAIDRCGDLLERGTPGSRVEGGNPRDDEEGVAREWRREVACESALDRGRGAGSGSVARDIERLTDVSGNGGERHERDRPECRDPHPSTDDRMSQRAGPAPHDWGRVRVELCGPALGLIDGDVTLHDARG